MGRPSECAARQLDKTYLVQVKGKLAAALQASAEITLALDDKACETRFKVLSYQADTDTSWLEIDLISGRKHQIRRHFAAVGHPVMGDPLYGTGNTNQGGLALQACALGFTCPIQGHQRRLELDNSLILADVRR